MSISAKSAASTPPAPERIVTTASRSSYSPDEQGADLELADGLLEGGELALGLGEGVGVALLLTHLDEGLEVLDAGVHAEDAVTLGVGAAQGARHLLRGVGVVPEVRSGGLLLELVDGAGEIVEVVTPRTESIVARRSLISCVKSTATIEQPTAARDARCARRAHAGRAPARPAASAPSAGRDANG